MTQCGVTNSKFQIQKILKLDDVDKIFNLNLVKFAQFYFSCENQSFQKINLKDSAFMILDCLVKNYFYTYILK